MNNHPIGVFDSGVGGISIWKEINRLLPNEDSIYLADSRNAPYGEKTKEVIRNLCIKNTEFLLQKGCKIIVVACNTATTNAISYLRAEYDVPFIGIEPAIKPAALKSRTKTVGVLATQGTLSSHLFHITAQNHASGITIVEQEGTGLVSLIESGQVASEETKNLLRGYLTPMLAAGIDHLVLGCTHYAYLVPSLQKLLPEGVKIIDCGEAVAKQTHNILEKADLLNRAGYESEHQFYTNGEVGILEFILKDVNAHKNVGYLDF